MAKQWQVLITMTHTKTNERIYIRRPFNRRPAEVDLRYCEKDYTDKNNTAVVTNIFTTED